MFSSDMALWLAQHPGHTGIYARNVNITDEELSTWGINVVIYANHMLRSAYPAMLNTAKSILLHARSYEANDLCMPVKDILELIPGTK